MGTRSKTKDGMRECPKCGRVLSVSEFYAKGNGLQSWCKDCCRERGRRRNGTTGKYRAEDVHQADTPKTDDVRLIDTTEYNDNNMGTMTTDIQIFNNPQFGAIRTAGTADAPMFCLADICRVLDLRVDGVTPRLREGGYNRIGVGVQTGTKKDGTPSIQMVDMLFVNEQNLYKVIMRSDKPQAEPFQDWVCGDVLPSIRKTGSYRIKLPQTYSEALRELADKAEMNERLMLENKEQQQRIDQQQEQLTEQKPKVVFADAVAGSRSSCLIGELAKLITQNGYQIGQNRLYEWLRENHYLGTYGEYYNIPNQRYIQQGLFELKDNVYSVNGEIRHRSTPKVTGKGQIYFVNIFMAMKEKGDES